VIDHLDLWGFDLYLLIPLERFGKKGLGLIGRYGGLLTMYKGLGLSRMRMRLGRGFP